MSLEQREMRERAVYPILIPLASILIIEIVVFFMSRILLVVNHNQATAFALAAAVGIMIGASLVAARPRISRGAVTGLLVVSLVGLVAAGGFALTKKPYAELQAEASRPEVAVAAADLAFDTEELDLSPGGTVIDFKNEDTQPHNIAIYESEEDLNAALFKGDIINGGASTAYEVGELEPGTYYFHCDVHPTMKGDAVVGASDEESPGAEGSGGH